MRAKANRVIEAGIVSRVEDAILSIRSHRVMLDADLAAVYGVTTKRLNEQVKRNQDRFPMDFMFQLTEDEAESLRSQIATSNPGRGGRRYLPFVFTEHGAVMAANVLNSKQAVRASIEVVRAFVRLRGIIASNRELAQKLAELEKKYDQQFAGVFRAIRSLMEPPPVPPKRSIGFRPPESSASGKLKARKH